MQMWKLDLYQNSSRTECEIERMTPPFAGLYDDGYETQAVEQESDLKGVGHPPVFTIVALPPSPYAIAVHCQLWVP